MAAYLLFFLISFASKIVLYFAHTNEVRKANYYSLKKNIFLGCHYERGLLTLGLC